MSGNLAQSGNKVKSFAKQSREHFSIIPNVIFEIGLDAYARDVYVYIRRVSSGESGQCWQSIPTIAKKLGISEMTVRRSIGKLLKRRLELGGKSLIRKVPSKHRSNTYVVVDIWDENSRMMRLRQPSTTEQSRLRQPSITEHLTPLPQNSKEDLREEDFFIKKREKTFLGNHKRPSGQARDPQLENSAQADLSQVGSHDEYIVPDSHDEEITVPDDVKSFMPPPPEIFDWLVSDIKRLRR